MTAMPRNAVLHGDCVEVMAGLPPSSIDAIVCDPPYGLEFMGKGWDQFRLDDPGTARHRGDRAGSHGDLKAENPTNPAAGRVEYGSGKRPSTSRCTGCGKRDQFRNDHGCVGARWATELIDPFSAPPTALAYGEWCRRWALEAYRVAKPGAHLLAFGGTRTYHRLASALEDAGWEIRDTLVWAYASGFPKSLDVSKAIDKAAGAERTLTRPGTTDDARTWHGWGTALKPAWEPIVLARKPLAGSVARNVLEHGTGALNIDGTRIPFAGEADRDESTEKNRHADFDSGPRENRVFGADHRDRADAGNYDPPGRWPANVLLTAPIFDGDTPGVVGGGEASYNPPGVFGQQRGDQPADSAAPFAVRRDGDGIFGYGDSGTYSRFFLIPKASRDDREPVLGGQLDERRPPGWSSGEQSPGTFQSRPTPARENVHPTVKPTELMRHLVRLVTPPGGLVLDPFLGSGTTALAAELGGFAWLGIEREAEYVAIAEARLNGTQRGLGLDVPAPVAKRSTAKSHGPAKRGPHKAEGWGFSSGQEGLLERTDDGEGAA